MTDIVELRKRYDSGSYTVNFEVKYMHTIRHTTLAGSHVAI